MISRYNPRQLASRCSSHRNPARLAAACVAAALGALQAFAATITVNPGDNLQTKINSAGGGDTVVINGGTYANVTITNRAFSSSAPLVIKKGSGGNAIIRKSDYSGAAFEIMNSSYIVIDGVNDTLYIEKGLRGLYIGSGSHHIIIKDVVIQNTGQPGVRIFGNSHHIDLLSSRITDTMKSGSNGEGIYLGDSVDAVDATHDIWIEGNRIHHIGPSDGIDIKGMVYNVTVRNNEFDNFTPNINGTGTAAINVSFINSGEDIGDDQIWVENNYVHHITDPYGDKGNGIIASCRGARIVGNTVQYCTYGLRVSNRGLEVDPVWDYNNTITNNGTNRVIESGTIYYNSAPTNPSSNPHSKQTWYGSGSAPAAPSGLVATVAASPNNYRQINLTWTDNSSNETGFKIERKKTSTGTYIQIATTGTNATSYSDTTCGSDVTYFYRVRAYNANGNSAYSAEASATTDPVTSGRQAQWKLNETSGTTAADASGNSNTGTLSGGPTWVAGAYGNGLSFDGVDDMVNCGSGASLDNLAAITVTAWIKPTTMGEGGFGRIVQKGAGTTAGWRFLTQGTNQIGFAVDYSTTDLQRVTPVDAISTGAWRHVAATWTGSATATNVTIYVDGVAVSSYATSNDGVGTRGNDGAVNLYLGNESGGTRTFNGVLDDVCVYNRVISTNELLAIYRRGLD